MRAPVTCLLGLALASCETRQPAATSAPARLPAPVAAVVGAVVAPVPPDTADCTRARPAREPGPADTLIALGNRHYWLAVRVQTDSTRALDYSPPGIVGPAYAAPGDSTRLTGRIRGYHETYTFTLRDSTRRQLVFRRQLHKPDFYQAVSRATATVMSLNRPTYVGYSAGLDALVLVCYCWIPASDVGERVTLVLDRQGRVRTISPGGSILWEASDCDPQVSPSGRAVLTCTELLQAGRPPLKLEKPHALLRAARFLNDTTLLVIYENGDPQLHPDLVADSLDASVTATMSPYLFEATPAQRRLPTAFVLTTSGRTLRRFNLKTTGAGACELPRCFVKSARTYYFLEEDSKLVLVPKAHPDRLVELPLRQLPRFKAPRRPHEQRYEINSSFTRLELYVDTLHPRSVRYQLRYKLAG